MLRMPVMAGGLAAFLWVAAAAAEPLSPYGVCAHLGSGQEYADLERELDLMQAAGMGWARADFTWGDLEPAEGRFDFSHYDQLVTAALKRAVTPLPILCYDSPWGGLAHQNLPAWTRFVEAVVQRYGDRLRHWEVWNEPNIEFWKPRPDPAQYSALLKATYATIKRVDPRLEVLYGGTAGIPLEFIRKTLELGAGECFDVLAIHPYSYPATPAAAGKLEELTALRALLAEFKAPSRIWITETGWPTHRDPGIEDYLPLWQSLVATAAAQTFPGRPGWDVAVLSEDGYEPSGQIGKALAGALSETGRFRCRPVSVAEIAAGLAPRDTQILIGPVGEAFPEPAFAGMLEFVRQGGLLVHLGGVPFYYTANRGPTGWPAAPDSAPESFRQALHIGWQAWWTRPDLPPEAGSTRPAAPDLAISLPSGGLKTTRWFTDAALKGADRMVPLLAGYNGESLVGYPSVLYRLDSDLKGAVLVNCLPIPVQRGVDPQTQARMLSRAYLTYLAHGVEVFFWYEFRDAGQQVDYNEHNFGMVTFDLQPKPAYVALQHLTAELGPHPRLALPPRTGPDGVTTVQFSGNAGKTVTVHWAEQPGASVPAPLTGGFRAYDALWQAAPVHGDAAGLRFPLDAGPIFVIPSPP